MKEFIWAWIFWASVVFCSLLGISLTTAYWLYSTAPTNNNTPIFAAGFGFALGFFGLGAMTVFELAAAGVGSILVPYPHAVDDHQTANAEYLVTAGAAIVRQQHELSSEWLCDTITEMTQQRDTLIKMAVAAREMARPNAANEVADRCMQAGGLA